jgi:hypothetical protein
MFAAFVLLLSVEASAQVGSRPRIIVQQAGTLIKFFVSGPAKDVDRATESVISYMFRPRLLPPQIDMPSPIMRFWVNLQKKDPDEAALLATAHTVKEAQSMLRFLSGKLDDFEIVDLNGLENVAERKN